MKFQRTFIRIKSIYKYYLTITTGFLIKSASYSQILGDNTVVNEEKRLHSEGESPFYQTEKSIGLVPEIQGINNYFYGL